MKAGKAKAGTKEWTKAGTKAGKTYPEGISTAMAGRSEAEADPAVAAGQRLVRGWTKGEDEGEDEGEDKGEDKGEDGSLSPAAKGLGGPGKSLFRGYIDGRWPACAGRKRPAPLKQAQAYSGLGKGLGKGLGNKGLGKGLGVVGERSG